MKKNLWLVAFLVLHSCLLHGQGVKHVSLQFSPSDFEISQNGDGSVSILSLRSDVSYKTDTLQPALPYIVCRILIGRTEEFVSYSYSGAKALFRSGVTVAPNSLPVTTDMINEPAPANRAVFYANSFYPSSNVEFIGSNCLGVYKFLAFRVCPFEYDALARKLYLKSWLDLQVNLSANPSTHSQSYAAGDREDLRDAVRRMVVNADELDTLYPLDVNRPGVTLTLQTGYEYVVVTSNAFKNVFQTLADWKNSKGIRAKVMTVDSIIANYSGATRQEKVKRALADIDGLRYVLLGGDTLNVPTQMSYLGILKDTTKYVDSIWISPSDYYYACLGTMNWDSNGNGLAAETSDYIDLNPTLHVSRVPVATITEAQNIVNRIIEYESMPDTLNWSDRILMGGQMRGGKLKVNGDSVYEAEYYGDLIYSTYINPTGGTYPAWNGTRKRFYESATDFSGGASYDFNAPNLQSQLATGYHFTDIITHGHTPYMEMEKNYPNYTWQYADALNNTSYTIITTTACHTNAFDKYSPFIGVPNQTDTCLSTHLMINPLSGVLAYWGSSRQNWYRKNGLSLEFSFLYDGMIYRKMLEERFHRMGVAATGVKITIDPTSYYDRWLLLSLNLLGDPEMPVYLEKPKTFANVEVYSVNDSIYVNADTTDYDICFINRENPSLYYTAREIGSANVSFARLDGVYDVCITKPGFIPWRGVIGDVYLQNKTLTGNRTYGGNHVYIGSNVTNKISQGQVVVQSGSTKVRALQDATITKDFQVSGGATFEITGQ